ncbi:MAG: hypothetical protein ACLFN8_01050 [Candidatus Woesearchaeota archaeon]
MSGNYVVLSNLQFLEPKITAAISAQLKNADFDGIILNGDFSGDLYVEQSHKSIKMRIKQEKKYKGWIKKQTQKEDYKLELSMHDFELPLLYQERRMMTSKEKRGYDYEDYMANTIEQLAKTQKEVYINPGRSERYSEYERVISTLQTKYSNIIDTTKNTVIKKQNHELAFIPGMMLDDPFIENAGFVIDKSYDTQICEKDTKEGKLEWLIFGLQTLTDKIKNPEKTTIFTSEMPQFKTNKGIDIYKLWKLQNDLILTVYDINIETDQKYEKGLIFDEFEAGIIAQAGGKLKPEFENVGDLFLREYFESLGLKKILINMPQQVLKGHDWDEKIAQTRKEYKDLVCVPSNMQDLIAGLINLNENKIAYSPLAFETYNVLN